MRAANSGTGYTLAQAEADYYAAAPAAAGTYDPTHKWDSALDIVGQEPLKPQGTPEQDFASPVPDMPEIPGDGNDGTSPPELRSTWSGVDLTRYLDEDYAPPTPTLLSRSDGVALLYPGLTHSIHGESESGKSMLMQYEAARLIEAGEHVLYLDFESDPGSIVERLLVLGASRQAIAARFTYLQPGSDPDRYGPDLEAMYATLDAHPYVLVVVDGVSESMDVVTGANRDVNAAAIEWTRKVPRRIADRTGAAVVQIDHVTKNTETRGRFAIGGQAKMSALTGAAYSLEVVRPLGRGLVGELMLLVAKDRPGYVRGQAQLARTINRMQQIAHIYVDSTEQDLTITLNPPPPPDDGGAERQMMVKVSGFLATLPPDHPGAGVNLNRPGFRSVLEVRMEPDEPEVFTGDA